MFFIPGPIIALLTFPGVIVHETAHLLFCKLFRIPVFDVCYFRFGNPSGYVLHQKTDRFVAIFFVCLGPFFINTALCIVFCLAAFLPVWVLKVDDILAYFFYWLGISIGMHSFPSSEDLNNLHEVAPAEAKRFNPLAILSLPLIYVLFVLNLARFVWADLGYGLAVGILAPLALFRAMVR